MLISNYEFYCGAGFVCFVSRRLLVFCAFNFVACPGICHAAGFFPLGHLGFFGNNSFFEYGVPRIIF